MRTIEELNNEELKTAMKLMIDKDQLLAIKTNAENKISEIMQKLTKLFEETTTHKGTPPEGIVASDTEQNGEVLENVKNKKTLKAKKKKAKNK